MNKSKYWGKQAEYGSYGEGMSAGQLQKLSVRERVELKKKQREMDEIPEPSSGLGEEVMDEHQLDLINEKEDYILDDSDQSLAR